MKTASAHTYTRDRYNKLYDTTSNKNHNNDTLRQPNKPTYKQTMNQIINKQSINMCFINQSTDNVIKDQSNQSFYQLTHKQTSQTQASKPTHTQTSKQAKSTQDNYTEQNKTKLN